jgi:hypothetical protein
MEQPRGREILFGDIGTNPYIQVLQLQYLLGADGCS